MLVISGYILTNIGKVDMKCCSNIRLFTFSKVRDNIEKKCLAISLTVFHFKTNMFAILVAFCLKYFEFKVNIKAILLFGQKYFRLM